jgi:hypothetical protein
LGDRKKGIEGHPQTPGKGPSPLCTPLGTPCVIPAKLVLVKTGSGNPEKDKIPILFERERGLVRVEYPQAPGRMNPVPLLLMFESQRTM